MINISALILPVDASELRVTTLTEAYKGPRRRPTYYPAHAAFIVKPDVYNCLTARR